jgi:hypothetical protein
MGTNSRFLLLLAVAALALFLIAAQPHPPGDYLSPKLRQDVNRLKQDAERQPTGRRTLVERGSILWERINAYSLTGGPVPATATHDVAPPQVRPYARIPAADLSFHSRS